MPTPPVGLPFDWHLPPVQYSLLAAKGARDVTALHALQLAPHSPYADVHELWAQGQSLDMGPDMPPMCALSDLLPAEAASSSAADGA